MPDGTLLRLTVFLVLFALFATAEALLPRRPRRLPRGGRWLTNLAMTALNTGVLRLMAMALPLLAVGAAVDARLSGLGLLNQIDIGLLPAFVVSILFFDFAIWAQHLVTHRIPFLWRFHRVHHADRDMDVTTAVRFHPVEIAASMGLKIGLVYLVGPPVLAILAFEVLLNGTALFNHANLRLAPWLDRALRWVLVTPDMHRIHHSVHRQEHDSNYGFALSVWDRIFRTYRATPQAGQDDMVVGLEWQDERPARLGWSLTLPFRR